MKTAKRTLSILLAVLLLLSVAPAAFAVPAREAAPEAATSGQAAPAAAPVPDASDAVIQRERAALQKLLPKSEHLTGVMHTEADGARMYYVEGEASVYGLLPARWVYADGSNVPPEKEPFVAYQASAGQGESFPATWDARTLGYITPVESQIAGTCWAHAAAAVMEANAVKKGLAAANEINLSEYQMVWFGLNGYCEGVTDSRNDGLTYGDTVDMLDRGGNYVYIGFAVNNHAGPAQESRYALDESLSKEAFAEQLSQTFTYANRLDRDYAVTEIRTYAAEAQAIKSAVLENGAAQLSYYSAYSYYTAYWNANGRISAYYYPNKVGTNHAVTVVGWDDSFSRENFKEEYRPAHDGAWLIKNSYGADWGNDGFFWLSYDDPNIDNVVAYSVESLDDRQNVYTYNGFLTDTNLSCTAAGNIFTATAGEYLTYVTSGAPITGSYTFKIYTGLPADAASPEAGTLKYTQSGTAAGEKWIPVTENVDLQPGERFSVVFENLSRIKTEGTVLPSNVALDKPLTCTSRAGESFAKISGTWQDTNALGKNNVGISAFTRDIGGAPYAVTFTCPGYYTNTVTTMTGTVDLPVTPDHIWVFTYHGQPFDGTGVDRNMTVTAHCYPTAGTVSAASACVTEFRCIYCGAEQCEAVSAHTLVPETVAPTREHPGCTRYTCSACGYTYDGDWTVHPEGQGAVEGNYVWQYYDGALSFAGTGALPDFTGQNQPRPWDVSRAGAVDLYIGEGITRIGEWNFCYQSALKNIHYPSTLYSIGETAFFCCHGLTEAVLPATVTEIGKEGSWHGIFFTCNGIKRLVLEEGLTSVNTLVYYGGGSGALEEIVLPSTLRTLSYVFYYSNMDSLQRWVVSPENPSFKSVDGVLYNKSGTTLLNYPASRPGVYYKAPAAVNGLGAYAFAELKTLKYLDLSETGVTTLNNMMFESTRSLTNLDLPAGLRTLGARAFRNNSAALAKLFVPSTVTSCVAEAFTNVQPLTLYTDAELAALSGLNAANVTVSVLPGHVHDYTEVAETVPGTCADPGYEIRVCACGQFACVETATGGHDWQWVYDVDPTCVTPGVKHKECSVCHATCEENTVAPATGEHRFTAEVVNDQTKAADATCTSGAKYYFSCESCGLIDRDDDNTFVSGDPIEHTWDWVYDVDPTCVTPGVKHKECTVCHARTEENTVAPATGEHRFTAEVVNDQTKAADATCTSGAKYYFSCESCGLIDRDDDNTFVSGDPIAHNWDWVYDVDPTCVTPGVKHKECTVCHATCEENTVAPATGEHKFTAEVVNDQTRAKDATCTSGAKYYFSCEDCGLIDRDDDRTFVSGDPIEHTWDWVYDVDPTCGAPGVKHKECTECHARTEENTVAPATGEHNWDWVYDVDPTCGTDGVKHRECTECHARTEENTVAPATGDHTYTKKTVSDDTLAVSATCTAKAKYYFTCNECGNIERNASHTFESGSALGHSYALVSQTNSTCSVQGEKKYQCSRCGDPYTEKLPLAAHTPVTVPGKPATCTETGLTEGVKCSECGAVLTAQTVIGKKAHSYGSWVREAEPSCTADGVEARYCSACGARDTRSVSKLGHVDTNGDYRCDRCNAEVGSPQPQSNCACGQ